MTPRSRRWFVGSLTASAFIGGCVAGQNLEGQDLVRPAPPNPAPLSFDLASGLRLHVIQTGWVAVKRPHRAFGGPDALAVPAIVGSLSWTNWLPVTAFAIEHPEGVLIVDTGETTRINTADYPDCGGGTGWFYRNQLRFALREEDEIGPQLRGLGIAPDGIKTLAMTHLHSDHMGGMHHFPDARVLVSGVDAQGHAGALMCRIPPALARTAIRHDGPAIDAFASSHAVTRDGAISLVPTPGHTRGHQSVLIRADGRSWLIAGDAVFDRGQVERGEIAGIAEDREAARRTVAVLREQTERYGTIIVPTHDPDGPSLLGA